MCQFSWKLFTKEFNVVEKSKLWTAFTSLCRPPKSFLHPVLWLICPIEHFLKEIAKFGSYFFHAFYFFSAALVIVNWFVKKSNLFIKLYLSGL